MNQATEHPISVAISAVEAALSPVTDAAAWSMTGEILAAALPRLSRVAAQVAELELRLVAQAKRSGIAGDRGAASAYALWSSMTRQTRPIAKHRRGLAQKRSTATAR